jgi:hypothetical protein
MEEHLPGDGVQRDHALNAMLLLEDIDFVAEARSGNGSSGGDHELNLHIDVNSPLLTKQATWSNGVVMPWSVTYDATTGEVNFDIAGQSLQWTGLGKFGELFVRTRAASANSSTLVDNMVLTLDSTVYTLSGSSHAYQTDDGSLVNDRDVLRVYNIPDYTTATLTGDMTFSWTGSMPTHSSLDMGLKFGHDVPEPATAGLLGVGGLLMLLRRRRAKSGLSGR